MSGVARTGRSTNARHTRPSCRVRRRSRPSACESSRGLSRNPRLGVPARCSHPRAPARRGRAARVRWRARVRCRRARARRPRIRSSSRSKIRSGSGSPGSAPYRGTRPRQPTCAAVAASSWAIARAPRRDSQARDLRWARSRCASTTPGLPGAGSWRPRIRSSSCSKIRSGSGSPGSAPYRGTRPRQPTCAAVAASSWAIARAPRRDSQARDLRWARSRCASPTPGLPGAGPWRSRIRCSSCPENRSGSGSSGSVPRLHARPLQPTYAAAAATARAPRRDSQGVATSTSVASPSRRVLSNASARQRPGPAVRSAWCRAACRRACAWRWSAGRRASSRTSSRTAGTPSSRSPGRGSSRRAEWALRRRSASR